MCDHFIQHYLMQYITGIILFLHTNLLSIFYQITWFSSNQITRYYLKQSTAYMKRIKDRQLFVEAVLHCTPFLCMYSMYIQMPYIKWKGIIFSFQWYNWCYDQGQFKEVAREKPIFSLLFFEQGYLT